MAQRFPMGSRVTGKVVRLTDFGAFVELEPGVDGLLHISQMSSRPIATPSEIVNVGDELTLLVIRVDPNERRIGLSLKELGHASPCPSRGAAQAGGPRGRRKKAQAARRTTTTTKRNRCAGGSRGRVAARRARCTWRSSRLFVVAVWRRRSRAARAGRRWSAPGWRSSRSRASSHRASDDVRRASSSELPRRTRRCAAVVCGSTARAAWSAPTQEITTRSCGCAQAGKPVVASLGSVAASGGYYIAVAADRIYANPGTLTGSIGVIMQLANVEGLLKKVGVDYVVVKAGQLQGHRQHRARHDARRSARVLQALLDDVHGQFIAAVAERPQARPRGRCVRFADGRVYSGAQAKDLKMVDELGGLEDAVAGGRQAGRAARAART